MVWGSATNATPVLPPRPKVYDYEEKVLSYSGLELNKELFVYDVPIELGGKNYKIHTYRCGDNNKEDMVLLHGYGGSSALYYPMLKGLTERYRVHCIDFVGMGLSSKEKFECQSTDETIDFILGSIEKWREAVGLEKFHLVGHSFGGYISGQYAYTHENRVKKVSLLSPIGITKRKPEEEPTIEDIKSKAGFWRRMFLGWIYGHWENKMTIGRFLQANPYVGKVLITRYLRKLFKLQDQEGEAVNEFMLGMHMLPEGAETAIHYILKPPLASAHKPLEEIIINKIKVPVDCYYGEFDYMDSTGAKRIQEQTNRRHFNLKTIPGAAHQLTMQNPKKVVEELLASQ